MQTAMQDQLDGLRAEMEQDDSAKALKMARYALVFGPDMLRRGGKADTMSQQRLDGRAATLEKVNENRSQYRRSRIDAVSPSFPISWLYTRTYTPVIT